MEGIRFKIAESKAELEQILSLQRQNLPAALSPETIKSDGFLTVEHDFDLLQKMNSKCAHSIAVHDDEVMGYALSMHPDFGESIDILKPMFRKIREQISSDIRFVVMGQVCIARTFRRKGIFKGLYDFMRDRLKNEFDWIITEVDMKNQRSLQAHLNSGFSIITEYRSNNRDWALIYTSTDFRSDSDGMPL